MGKHRLISEEQKRAILDQFYEIDDMANQISQHLDYLEFLLEKAGVLEDKAKHHYSKHDWQHMR